MKNKSIGTLLIVAVAVSAAAFFAVQSRRTSNAAPDERGALLPDLVAKANDVASITLHAKGETTTLKKQDDTWQVVDAGGYPAKPEKIVQTIGSIALLQIEELKTRLPERYADLDLDEPGADSEARRVVLADASGAVVADIILGKVNFRQRGRTVYARRQGEEQTYLCSGNLVDLESGAKSWVEAEIVKLPTDELADVRIVHADGEIIELERMAPDSSQFLIANKPEDREESYQGVANGIASNLTSLRLDDVRPIGEIDFEAEPVSSVEYAKKDGEVLVVQAARFDDQDWIRLSAVYRAPVAEEVVTVPADPEAEPIPELEAEELADPAAVQERVDAFNARMAGWAYAVPSYKFNNFSKRMEELLAALEDEEEGAGELPEDLSGLLEGLPLTPEPQAEVPEEQGSEDPSDPDHEGDGHEGDAHESEGEAGEDPEGGR